MRNLFPAAVLHPPTQTPLPKGDSQLLLFPSFTSVITGVFFTYFTSVSEGFLLIYASLGWQTGWGPSCSCSTPLTPKWVGSRRRAGTCSAWLQVRKFPAWQCSSGSTTCLSAFTPAPSAHTNSMLLAFPTLCLWVRVPNACLSTQTRAMHMKNKMPDALFQSQHKTWGRHLCGSQHRGCSPRTPEYWEAGGGQWDRNRFKGRLHGLQSRGGWEQGIREKESSANKTEQPWRLKNQSQLRAAISQFPLPISGGPACG